MKSELSWLNRLLNVREEEESLVKDLFLHHFIQGLGISIYYLAALTIFVKTLDFGQLALSYAIAAILLLVVGRIYAYFEHHLPIRKVLRSVLGSLVVLTTLASALALSPLGHSKGVVFGILVGYHLIYLLSNLEFWGLTALIFDIRQSKRLFGLISAGDIPAKMLGSMAVSALAALHLPLEYLFLPGVLLMVIAYRLLGRILDRVDPARLEVKHAHGEEPIYENAIARFFKSRFILLLGALSFIGVLSATFIEFTFLKEVKFTFKGDADLEELAQFFGLFYSSVYGLTLLMKLFFSSRIIQRLGIQKVMLITPIALGLPVLGIVILNMVGGGSNAFIFAFGMVYLIWIMFNYALNQPLFLALFQPLDQNLRLHGHTVIKGLIDPLAKGLGGAVLFGLIYFYESTESVGNQHSELITTQGYILFGLIALWLIMVLRVNEAYKDTLRQAIQKRRLSAGNLFIDKDKSLEVIHSKLKSEHAGEVIYALRFLKEHQPESYDKSLLEALGSKDSNVLMFALSELKAKQDSLEEEGILHILHNNPDPSVHREAIKSLCQLDEMDLELIQGFLEGNLDEKHAAIVGMIDRGDVESVVIAGQHLLDLLRSESAIERKTGVDITGEIGVRNFYRPVLKALRDDNPAVVRSAVKASAQVSNPRFVPELLALIEEDQHRPECVHALIQIGEQAMLEVEDKMAQTQDPYTVAQLLTVCGRINSKRAHELILDKLVDKRFAVRRSAIASLLISELSRTEFNATEIQSCRNELAQHLCWLSEAEEILSPIEPEFAAAIRNARIENTRMYFHLLACTFQRGTILRVLETIFDPHSDRKANAMEALDNILPEDISRFVLALVESNDPKERIQHLRALSMHKQRPQRNELVDYILKHEQSAFDRWTVSQAVLRAEPKQAILMEPFLNEKDPFLREIALQRLGHMFKSGSNVDQYLDANRITELKQNLRNMESSDKLMLIEKVIILKGSGLFSQTPENVLIDVAGILQEERLSAEHTIFNKGDEGNCMYIIYEGQVRIHDDKITFAKLGARDFFGEFALLDSEPRSAAATTTEETYLLRLDQDLFYEMMAERIEVARSILKTLTRRLRKQNDKLHELEASRKEVLA